MENKIICGDCLKIIPTLPKARMVFADPPDNLKVKYGSFKDFRWDYNDWIEKVAIYSILRSNGCAWISFYYKYIPVIMKSVGFHQSGFKKWTDDDIDFRMLIWRFTFGRNRKLDCTNGYRPILRISRAGIVWNIDNIRVLSDRQLKYNDKRANPLGKVPDDVWEFPRVCGTFKERRKWIPNQHPEALVERMILMSTSPGDLVIDMFAGSGTVHRVCKRLGRNSISIEINPEYVERMQNES